MLIDESAVNHHSRGALFSFAKLSLNFCSVNLNAEVNRLLGGWVDHVNHQDYVGGWDVLSLRCSTQHRHAHPILQSFAVETDEDWIDLPVLQQCPTLCACLQSLPCEIKSARLMRLKSGAWIKPHRDVGLSLLNGEVRLHLPIQTSDDIVFKVNQLIVPMRAGELWYINADQVHEVHNLSVSDRINLVVDCKLSAALMDLIEQSEVYG